MKQIPLVLLVAVLTGCSRQATPNAPYVEYIFESPTGQRVVVEQVADAPAVQAVNDSSGVPWALVGTYRRFESIGVTR